MQIILICKIQIKLTQKICESNLQFLYAGLFSMSLYDDRFMYILYFMGKDQHKITSPSSKKTKPKLKKPTEKHKLLEKVAQL